MAGEAATPSRKRLVIKEMVLENFKSYAGVQRIGPFHKARTSPVVVPPTTARPRPRSPAHATGQYLLQWRCPPAEAALGCCRAASKALGAFVPRAWCLTTRLPLAQSFSSVVGPNGSGKSNVIDALLFVFGKRAKQVRGAHFELAASPGRLASARPEPPLAPLARSCGSTRCRSSSTAAATTRTWNTPA